MPKFPAEELDLLDLKGFLVGEKVREFIPQWGISMGQRLALQ